MLSSEGLPYIDILTIFMLMLPHITFNYAMFKNSWLFYIYVVCSNLFILILCGFVVGCIGNYLYSLWKYSKQITWFTKQPDLFIVSLSYPWNQVFVTATHQCCMYLTWLKPYIVMYCNWNEGKSAAPVYCIFIQTCIHMYTYVEYTTPPPINYTQRINQGFLLLRLLLHHLLAPGDNTIGIFWWCSHKEWARQRETTSFRSIHCSHEPGSFGISFSLQSPSFFPVILCA